MAVQHNTGEDWDAATDLWIGGTMQPRVVILLLGIVLLLEKKTVHYKWCTAS